MDDQRRVESQEAPRTVDGRYIVRSSPPLSVPASGSARGVLSDQISSSGAAGIWDSGYQTGQDGEVFLKELPQDVTGRIELHDLLVRGQERYQITCAPCHDLTGSGNGMVPRRGFKFPPSFHTSRLRAQPVGYLFHVATRGRGEMVGYELDVSTDDRWAIAAYVRALQWSQHVPVSELSDTDREKLESTSDDRNRD